MKLLHFFLPSVAAGIAAAEAVALLPALSVAAAEAAALLPAHSVAAGIAAVEVAAPLAVLFVLTPLAVLTALLLEITLHSVESVVVCFELTPQLPETVQYLHGLWKQLYSCDNNVYK